MNKRDAGLQVGRNRLFLIFCFFCIKTKEKHTVFEPFNLRIYFENFTMSHWQNDAFSKNLKKMKNFLLQINPLKKKVKLLLLLFSITSMFSCGNIKEVIFNGIENVAIKSLSAKGVEAEISVSIKNPNSFSFTIYKSEMDVTISGIHLGKASISNKIKIKAKSEQVYVFKIKSDFSNLSLADLPKLISLGMSKKVTVGLKGNLKGGKLLIKRSYPVDIVKSVNL